MNKGKYTVMIGGEEYTISIGNEQYTINYDIISNDNIVYTFDEMTRTFNVKINKLNDFAKYKMQHGELYITYSVQNNVPITQYFKSSEKREEEESCGRVKEKYRKNNWYSPGLNLNILDDPIYYKVNSINDTFTFNASDIKIPRGLKHIIKLSNKYLHEPKDEYYINVKFYLYYTNDLNGVAKIRFLKTTCQPFKLENKKLTLPYFYFEALENNCTICLNDYFDKLNVYYSFDGNNWRKFEHDEDGYGFEVSVPNGSILYCKGNNPNGFGSATSWFEKFSGEGKFNVGGDITTLLNENGNVNDLTNYGSGCFAELFGVIDYPEIPNVDIISAKNLKLPATTLAEYCYSSMFRGCKSLTTAPELPATTLAEVCYGHMFSGCSSLTTAPELPATDLANYCYSSMFSSCKGLTNAPELPATTLAYGCYSNMFLTCSGLTTAPELPATTLASGCYQQMFSSCKGLTTAPELPATTLVSGCYRYMFSGCSSLTAAPELPATTLAGWCYESMFYGCTSLTSITHHVSNWNTSHTSNWLYGVASTGTVTCPENSTIPSNSDSGIPTGWSRQNI